MNNPQFFPELKALDGVPFHTHEAGDLNITKATVGLGNVDNTSDLSKPISTATQTALNAKLTATKAAAQANFAGVDAAAIVVELNAFLAKLKTANLIA